MRLRKQVEAFEEKEMTNIILNEQWEGKSCGEVIEWHMHEREIIN